MNSIAFVSWRTVFVVNGGAAGVWCAWSLFPYLKAVNYYGRVESQYDAGHSEYIQASFDRLLSGKEAKDRFVIEALDESPGGKALAALRESARRADEARHRRAVEILVGILWLAISLLGSAIFASRSLYRHCGSQRPED
jgi:hypothetical protein